LTCAHRRSYACTGDSCGDHRSAISRGRAPQLVEQLCCHESSLVLLAADITTKDLLTDRQLWRNPPCCPGARSPARLARSWLTLCCAPTTCRPWQRQQQRAQRSWQRLPLADDALPVAVSGASSRGSSSEVQMEAHSALQGTVGGNPAAAVSPALLNRQQSQQLAGSVHVTVL
jgi:hypothetical protein